MLKNSKNNFEMRKQNLDEFHRGKNFSVQAACDKHRKINRIGRFFSN